MAKNNTLSLEDLEAALFGREDDENASALDEIPNTELDDDINGGPSMNTPDDLNDQDSQDDIQNSFHDGNTGDEQTGLEDDELFLDEGTDDDSAIVDTDETADMSADVSDSIGGDGTDVAEAPVENTEIIADATQQEVPETAVDEANGDISNPPEAMESWLNNLSLEDLEIAVSDGEDIDEKITVGDDGATTVQNNNSGGSDNDDSDSSSDNDSGDGDDDLSNLDKESDDDSDEDESSDDEDDKDEESKEDDEGDKDEEDFDFLSEDYL